MNNKKIMFWIIVIGIVYIIVISATMILNKIKESDSVIAKPAKQKSGMIQKKGQQATISVPLKADKASEDEDMDSSPREKGVLLQ